MRNTMAILASAIILCGLYGYSDKPIETTISGKSVYSPPSDIYRVKFDGHIYLLRGNSATHPGGICHDPDCPCLTQ